MSEPLGILAQAVERISPTLIEFELGSDVEVILMKLLYKLRPNYNDFLIISFYDGYAAFRKYVENIFEEEYVRRVFESAKLLSINSFLEEDFNPLEDLKTSQPDIIAGRALRITEALPQRTLVLVLGLDLYGVRDGEKNLIQLFPRLMTVLNRREGFRTIVTFNTGIFSLRWSTFSGASSSMLSRSASKLKVRRSGVTSSSSGRPSSSTTLKSGTTR
ncbi:hypothetical protein [Thermococcus peptonophilus]|uniref:hypothetical protein n=1 Tax=Thermococcus peptonophilus TaxID=53952 RepID=UPI0006D28D4A